MRNKFLFSYTLASRFVLNQTGLTSTHYLFRVRNPLVMLARTPHTLVTRDHLILAEAASQPRDLEDYVWWGTLYRQWGFTEHPRYPEVDPSQSRKPRQACDLRRLLINDEIKTWNGARSLRMANRGYMCDIEQTGRTLFA